MLSRLQEYPEADRAYRKALALDPNLPAVQLNLGLAEFKQGKLDAAIEPLRAALASDPRCRLATVLGLSYYGVGQFKEASEQLEKAVKSDPENAELHGVLAQSCLSAKDYTCALDEFTGFRGGIRIPQQRTCLRERRSTVWGELPKRFQNLRLLRKQVRAPLTCNLAWAIFIGKCGSTTMQPTRSKPS